MNILVNTRVYDLVLSSNDLRNCEQQLKAYNVPVHRENFPENFDSEDVQLLQEMEIVVDDEIAEKVHIARTDGFVQLMSQTNILDEDVVKKWHETVKGAVASLSKHFVRAKLPMIMMVSDFLEMLLKKASSKSLISERQAEEPYRILISCVDAKNHVHLRKFYFTMNVVPSLRMCGLLGSKMNVEGVLDMEFYSLRKKSHQKNCE